MVINQRMLGEKWTQVPVCLKNAKATETAAQGCGALTTSTTRVKELKLKCLTYNVESISMDRLRQITDQMRRANYPISLLQGTKWNFDGCLWSNGYKVYNAPAAKASMEANAGVRVLLDQRLLHETRVTPNINLDHRIMTIRVHFPKFDICVITAYSPGKHTPCTDRNKFWTCLTTTVQKLL